MNITETKKLETEAPQSTDREEVSSAVKQPRVKDVDAKPLYLPLLGKLSLLFFSVSLVILFFSYVMFRLKSQDDSSPPEWLLRLAYKNEVDYQKVILMS